MRTNLQKVFLLVFLSFIGSSALAQKLEVKGGQDETSVSIRMKNDVPSSRVIIQSPLDLNYRSNMNDLGPEDVVRAQANKMNVDTLYFYTDPQNCKRRVTVSADGYASEVLSFTFKPKQTYNYLIFDASSAGGVGSLEDPESQYTMAQNFDFGEGGFGKSDKEAVSWYQKSALQGHTLAQYNLAMKYKNGGTGVRSDMTQAAKWFEEAAKSGHTESQYHIGSCYRTGDGVSRSSRNAQKWLLSAAMAGNVDAQYELGVLLSDGGSDMPQAVTWLKKAAEANHSDAQFLLGKILYEGQNYRQDKASGIAQLTASSNQYNVDATLYLGSLYLVDTEYENSTLGLKLLDRADELGSAEAARIATEYRIRSQQLHAVGTSWGIGLFDAEFTSAAGYAYAFTPLYFTIGTYRNTFNLGFGAQYRRMTGISSNTKEFEYFSMSGNSELCDIDEEYLPYLTARQVSVPLYLRINFGNYIKRYTRGGSQGFLSFGAIYNYNFNSSYKRYGKWDDEEGDYSKSDFFTNSSTPLVNETSLSAFAKLGIASSVNERNSNKWWDYALIVRYDLSPVYNIDAIDTVIDYQGYQINFYESFEYIRRQASQNLFIGFSLTYHWQPKGQVVQ